jgi:hypothetical protein
MSVTGQAVPRLLEKRSGRQYGVPGFPIETSVSYRALGVRKLSKVGNGRTISISSKTITFTPARELPNGIGLQMVIKWPSFLHGSIRMYLILYGVVTSADSSATTMEIVRFEFQVKEVSAGSKLEPR